jgi:RNA polymerase sigma factor (sigma-70 family)
MAKSSLNTIVQQVRRTVLPAEGSALTDVQLLESFITRRDEAAFEALVLRQGPIVLGVCRRMLRHAQDAEDAFQATFLVLVRKAASVVPRELVGNWLYGVAYYAARKALTAAVKCRARERQVVEMPEPEAAPGAERWHDLHALLDEEWSRLPDKYRVAIVLCDLEGNGHREAARQIGCPQGTLSARVSRGRALLAKRLARHGLPFSGSALAVALCQGAVPAAVPTSLLASTVKAGSLMAAGRSVTAGLVSAEVAALTKGVLQTMLLSKLKIATAVLLAGGLIAGVVTGTAYQATAPPEATGSPYENQQESAVLHPDRKVVSDIWTGRSTTPFVEVSVGASDKGAGSGPSDRPAATFGPEINGLCASVALAKQKYLGGEPIAVTYVVKNVSKEKQILWHSGFWPNHRIVVRDGEGKEPSLPPLGRQRFQAFSPGGPRETTASFEVPPGGEDAAYEKYDLTQHYDLTRPAQYTVQYLYEEKQGGWEGRLPSNEAAFEVVAKEEK